MSIAITYDKNLCDMHSTHPKYSWVGFHPGNAYSKYKTLEGGAISVYDYVYKAVGAGCSYKYLIE